MGKNKKIKNKKVDIFDVIIYDTDKPEVFITGCLIKILHVNEFLAAKCMVEAKTKGKCLVASFYEKDAAVTLRDSILAMGIRSDTYKSY